MTNHPKMSSGTMIVQGVNGVQFSIMGPDEIRRRSVVEVTKNETYEKDIPVVKGLFDLRMGTTIRSIPVPQDF